MSNHTEELMEPWGYNLAAGVLFAIQIFGFSLNLFVLVLMWRDKQIWNPINRIIFNLVCDDFSVAIIGNPAALTSALCHRWIFGEMGCQFYGFFMALLGINSITTMAVMSFERFFVVRYPFSSKQLTNCGARWSILAIWVYSFAVTCPPLFGWGAYVSEAANISCSVNWEEQSSNARSYITFLFAFGLAIPLLVNIFCYVGILVTMKKSSARLNRTNPAERRVIIMIFIMFAFFMFGWSPYAVFALIKQYGNADLISPAMGVLPSIFAKVSICYNPIIYVGLNTQFRQAFDRWRGVTPTKKIMTVSTTANLLDTDARETMRNKLQTLNVNEDVERGREAAVNLNNLETAENVVTIEMHNLETVVNVETIEMHNLETVVNVETIEMYVINEKKREGKKVTIKTE